MPRNAVGVSLIIVESQEARSKAVESFVKEENKSSHLEPSLANSRPDGQVKESDQSRGGMELMS